VNTEPARADRCPLCGEPNECGVLDGKEGCWCFSETMPPEIRDKIPPEARAACVCQRCARASE
jgi:hypothetical protein